jgi:hypothetical protein
VGLGVRDAWVEVHSYGGVGENGRQLGLAPWAKPNLVYFICVCLFTPNPSPSSRLFLILHCLPGKSLGDWSK